MITARIEADSISHQGTRLTTFVLTYPRFIHSELMTHRMFSRNAASSRAIQFDRMVRMIQENPAMPIKWGTKQKGMQSGEPVDETTELDAQALWLDAMELAIRAARALDDWGIHKSISNRLVEPFAHMTTIVTATEWRNFFNLRAHPDAMPEFQELAYMMLDLYMDAFPRRLCDGEWHTPLVNENEFAEFPDADTDDLARKVSVARCCRISYLNFVEASLVEDIALHDRVAKAGHWSPFEHQASPWGTAWSGNFRGWRQYRSFFPEQNSENVILAEIRARRPRGEL